jgi:peptide-methionine (R)-S-oxide reductase
MRSAGMKAGFGIVILWAAGMIAIAGCNNMNAKARDVNNSGKMQVFSVERNGLVDVDRVVKTENEWRMQLSPEQYQVAREKGTERPFTCAFNGNRAKGLYRCVCCGNDLFISDTKFDSGTGWPSFFTPVHANNVRLAEDRSHFMTRTEVLCSRCDAHLGHVFDDGPPPTGRRYCMNSASMVFVPGQGDISRGKIY